MSNVLRRQTFQPTEQPAVQADSIGTKSSSVPFNSPATRAGFLLNQCYDFLIGTYPMSEEQLKSFIAKVQADTSLQEQLKAAADSDAALGIAKEAGFAITAEDIQSMKSSTDLSDEELEGVAGGGELRNRRADEEELQALYLLSGPL